MKDAVLTLFLFLPICGLHAQDEARAFHEIKSTLHQSFDESDLEKQWALESQIVQLCGHYLLTYPASPRTHYVEELESVTRELRDGLAHLILLIHVSPIIAKDILRRVDFREQREFESQIWRFITKIEERGMER